MEKEKKSIKSKLINIFIVLVIIVISIFMYAKYYETTKIIVNDERIISEKLPSNFNGVKVVYFTDTLIGSTFNVEDVDNLVSNINSYKTDIILFGGNLLNKNVKLDKKILTSLTKLDSSLGKYFVMGYLDSEEVSTSLESIGFKKLDNISELIYNDSITPICLYGVSSYNNGNSKLDELTKCEGLYTLVFTHEGDVLSKIEKNKYNLFVAGNSLGGEINIPFYGELYKFEGSKKYYKTIKNDSIYISNGIGTIKSFLRFNNYPSFTLFRLKSTVTK